MNFDEVLEAVERVLLSRQLESIELFVLQSSWLGRSYDEMAHNCGYGSNYIKELGSQLWQDLSKAVGKRVTKKNMHLVLSQYILNGLSNGRGRIEQEFQSQLRTECFYPVREYGNTSVLAAVKLEFPYNPVPLGSPYYIYRPPVEELVFAEITQPGCVICVKAPRKMGKSSLLHRIIAHTTALEYKTVYLNFQEADEIVFASLDKFLRWFCANVSRQLNLNPKLDDYWDEDMGSKMSCKIYFQSYLLQQADSPLVLALDEVNRVFEHPKIAQDFLPMLRSWHEQAKHVETWQKLRLVVAHTTEVYIPLKINQSPFNVGLSITLPQFTLEQVQELARRYGIDWATGDEGKQRLASLVAMVGGHPYLVSIALYYLCRGGMTLEELLLDSSTPAGIYSNHLRSLLEMLSDEPQLASALRQIMTAQGSVQLDAIAQSAMPSAIAAYKLESMGLIQLDGNRACASCQLYRLYFQEQLAEEDWIDTHLHKLEREKQELRRTDNIDALTKLSSWYYFNQYLEAKWSQWIRERSPVSIFVCDVDYFKYFNDAYGHQVGDACLQIIAETIQQCVNHQASVVARNRDTEFAAILPQTTAKAAVEIAENIRKSVKAQALAHDQSKIGGFPASVVTVSLGVASTTPSPRTSPAMLVAAAQEAIAQSKRRGRNCVTISSSINEEHE